MSFEPETDERKAAAYVGLPLGQQFEMAGFTVSGAALPGGQGYRIAHWGVRVEWDLAQDGEPPWPHAAAAGSISSVEWVPGEDGTLVAHPIDDGPVVFQLWLIQAYRPEYPLAAERRWCPGLGVKDALIGFEEPHASDDVLAAWRGQRLLAGHQAELNLSRRGRFETRALFLKDIGEAVREVRRQRLYPSRETVVRVMNEWAESRSDYRGTSETAVKAAQRSYGLEKWAAVLAEISDLS